jgi:hypothetical protein
VKIANHGLGERCRQISQTRVLPKIKELARISIIDISLTPAVLNCLLAIGCQHTTMAIFDAPDLTAAISNRCRVVDMDLLHLCLVKSLPTQ